MKLVLYAFIVAVIVGVALGPVLIPMLRRLKFGQIVREEGPKTHLKKQGTPTMGGIIIIAALLVGTLAFSLNATELVLPALLVTMGFSIIGFLDDFLKIKQKNTVGLRPYQKIIGQFALALVLAIYAYKSPFIGSKIYLAFFNAEWDLGLFYIPVVMFVIIGTVNSVNLQDGVDGICSGVTSIYAAAMAVIFMYISGAVATAGGQAVMVQYGEELRSMAIFSAAVSGACVGFLKHNSHPAKVIMGDTGSFALGGAIACMAIFSRSILLLPVMGACFVASSLSSIIQVASYKLRRKRVFRMAPLHHHFELGGSSETRIVAGYMIVTLLLCLVCLLAFV